MEGHGLKVSARKRTNARRSKSPPLHRLIQSTPQNGRAQPNLQLGSPLIPVWSQDMSVHSTNKSFCRHKCNTKDNIETIQFLLDSVGMEKKL